MSAHGTATWKISDYGDVAPDGRRVIFPCPHCGHEASLPVKGLPIAQTPQGIVFDIGPHAVPKVIQCRKCRKTLESWEPKTDVR